eukprot:TRINITY_DN438_c0_g1_i11.p1 TRINITY_DN438_c0_g1~~TRINITY_DN438_c0_g1_i11.p1  ORF type:complete len:137 (-),score=30.90 TRINITY_DN438_c0_g1_i11:188-598(-)
MFFRSTVWRQSLLKSRSLPTPSVQHAIRAASFTRPQMDHGLTNEERDEFLSSLKPELREAMQSGDKERIIKCVNDMPSDEVEKIYRSPVARKMVGFPDESWDSEFLGSAGAGEGEGEGEGDYDGPENVESDFRERD